MAEQTHDLSRLRINRDREPARARRPRGRIIAGVVALVALAAGAIAIVRPHSAPVVRVALAEFSGGGSGGGSLLTANGYVVARTQASISSKIMGRLEYLGVTEGAKVNKGEVLARLDDQDYAAALKEAEARRAQAEAARVAAQADRDQLSRDVARSRELVGRGLVSTQEAEALAAKLDAAEAQVRVAAAQAQEAGASVAVATANLENTRIRAPFSGTVLRKDAEVGEVVAPAATGTGLTRGAVLTMADLSTLEVEVDVNEGYIARIRHDQPATIVLDAYPDATFRGRVRQVMPTADRQRATVQVKVAILDTDPRILPEMGARVEFMENAGVGGTGGAAVHVMVPAEAVRDEEGRSVVWIVKDGRLEKREVTALQVSGGRREIRQGLAGGEEVVTTVVRGTLSPGARAEKASS